MTCMSFELEYCVHSKYLTPLLALRSKPIVIYKSRVNEAQKLHILNFKPWKSNFVRCASEDTCMMRESPPPGAPLLITLSNNRWVSRKGPANFHLII